MLAAITGAIRTVLPAVLTVVTLPFRLVARLLGGAKRRAPSGNPAGTRRQPKDRRPDMGDRHVIPEGDQWKVINPDGVKATTHTDTQEEAVARAREIIRNDGGGELVVHGTDGQIRDKRTLTAASAPNSASAPRG